MRMSQRSAQPTTMGAHRKSATAKTIGTPSTSDTRANPLTSSRKNAECLMTQKPKRASQRRISIPDGTSGIPRMLPSYANACGLVNEVFGMDARNPLKITPFHDQSPQPMAQR
jgi:hypothetical protein